MMSIKRMADMRAFLREQPTATAVAEYDEKYSILE